MWKQARMLKRCKCEKYKLAVFQWKHPGHYIWVVYWHICTTHCAKVNSPWSICWLALFSLIVVVVSMVTSPFISIVWCFRPYKPYIFWKLIIWWWQWPRRILTERQRHTYTDKDKYKVLPRPNAIFIKSRGFKDLKYYIGCLLVMTKTKMFMHY